jgi:CheY-like chemotaxis protein
VKQSGETKVLYVDDEPANLTVFRRQFKSTMEIRTASSGAEALEILETEEIPVLLTDQKMPKMSGAELAHEVRRRHPDVVRMVVTAYADFDAVVRAINDGHVTRYIRKPWNAAELRTIITTACELYWTTKQNRALTEDLLHQKRLSAVAGMAEDLTRELVSIGGTFEVIERMQRSSASARDDIDAIQRAVNRLAQMIDDLRQFSKRSTFDRGAVSLQDLNELVAKSAELLRLFPAIRSLSSLELALAAEPLPIEVDPQRVTQLMVNVVFNLVSDDFRPAAELALATRAEAGAAIVSFVGPRARGGLWLLLAQRVLNDYGGTLKAAARGELELAIPLKRAEREEPEESP